MSLELIGSLYGYHRWANRRLFEAAVPLGNALEQDMGKQWSVPTVKGMFAHVYGADRVWLARWKGATPPPFPRAEDFPALADLRAAWDRLEAEQQAYVAGLAESDLARPVRYRNSEGTEFSVPLGPLLQHVVNHATHHRSEIATMVTLISASPPDTGMVAYRTTVLKG
jgi:uncharacterized damage-inducible protein DinB